MSATPLHLPAFEVPLPQASSVMYKQNPMLQTAKKAAQIAESRWRSYEDKHLKRILKKCRIADSRNLPLLSRYDWIEVMKQAKIYLPERTPEELQERKIHFVKTAAEQVDGRSRKKTKYC